MPKGGLARRATAIAQLRAQTAGPVLLLDAGNSLLTNRMGATSDPSEGALTVEAMNALQYDAMALGERELLISQEVVQQRLQETTFPILSANVGPAGVLPQVQPYLLRSLDGHTVVIVGLTAPAAATRARFIGLELTVQDAAAALQETLAQIDRPNAAVIVLSNLDRTTNQALAKAVPGLAAIIGVASGQQLQPLAVPGPTGQVILHASSVQGQCLGRLTLELNPQGQVVAFSGEVLQLDSKYANDPAMVQMMQRYGVKP